jgi:hypothetical protein
MDPAWGCPAKIALPGSTSGGRSVTLGTEDRELRARLGLRKRHDRWRERKSRRARNMSFDSHIGLMAAFHPPTVPACETHLRLRPGSGYEQAESELCRVEVDEVAVALGPLA